MKVVLDRPTRGKVIVKAFCSCLQFLNEALPETKRYRLKKTQGTEVVAEIAGDDLVAIREAEGAMLVAERRLELRPVFKKIFKSSEKWERDSSEVTVEIEPLFAENEYIDFVLHFARAVESMDSIHCFESIEPGNFSRQRALYEKFKPKISAFLEVFSRFLGNLQKIEEK